MNETVGATVPGGAEHDRLRSGLRDAGRALRNRLRNSRNDRLVFGAIRLRRGHDIGKVLASELVRAVFG